MTAAAFFRAANIIALDYPYQAAIASALRICDEACIVVGQSADDTRAAIYAEQERYGADRVKIREETFVFDRGWQERWWDWCREMTTADWHMYHDLDECIHEAHAATVRQLMTEPGAEVIIFPYVHLYGDAFHYVLSPTFYTHNGRLGRASAGYRMRNWCSDEHPTHAACMMVVPRKGIEVDAHNVRDPGGLWTNVPIVHYGWCRTPVALARSQAKHRAWYADGGGMQDGRISDPKPYNYNMEAKSLAGFIGPYDGPHSDAIRPWLEAHAAEWRTLRQGVNV